MCYPLPAPRCSHHTRIRLAKAQAAYDAAPEVNKEEAEVRLREARDDYYRSPAGLRELMNCGDMRRHERFAKQRKERLAQYRQTVVAEARATDTSPQRLYRMLAEKNTPKEARVVIAERLASSHPVWRSFPKELAVGQLLGKQVPR